MGYAFQPAYMPAPVEAQQGGARYTGWLIGGVTAAILAVGGIGVGIYLAASGSSAGQARLLATPVVAGSGSVEQTSPSASRPAASSHRITSTNSPAPSAGIPTVGAPTRPSLGQSRERQAVADTIQRHFSLITEHKFSAAYALLAPSLQNGESSWVAAHREDGIYNVDVAVRAKLHSPESATATIAKMTTLDGHGCKDWSGSWGLTKIAGHWRISKSGISSTPC